jgi:predicted CoA-binding protein
MPLTAEVGRTAVETLKTDGRRLGVAQLGFGPGLTFESWLSLLSDDQPQLSDAENRDNAALFAHLRDAIATLLLEAQHDALGAPAPAWLYELVAVLHRRQATVITLNYDTLIETAIENHSVWDPFLRRCVTSSDVLQDLPPKPNVGARLAGPLCHTVGLLKLHGSLNWWAVPNDSSGATINREERLGAFEEPYEITIEERQRELPGRERFIIPPLSTKGTYYRNPLTRELWHQAYEALRTASRISIVGYSVPPADLVMANMLREALSNRDVKIEVVNPDPDALSERLLGLGASPDALEVVSGSDCVEVFANSLCRQASATLADALRESLLSDYPDAALAVAWGDPSAIGPSVRRVAQLAVGPDETLELILDEDVPPVGATAARRAADGTPSSDRFPSAADMTSALGHCKRVIARDAGGEYTLVAAWHEGRNVGASAQWIMFAPADRGPR